jgi:RHS repeat-associated protein
MNRLNQIGGAGKTVVEGTLDEPATVSVSGQPAQVSSQPGTSDFKFQKEIPVTQGTNNFQITATDARGNARTQNYSVQVGPAQKTYEYDLNGNLLREKDPVGTIIRSFEWDAVDRLRAFVSGSQRIEWTYNSQGQKVLETTNGTASKRYLWDGSSLLLERTPTGVITKRFYADGEQRVGGTDAGNYHYTRDHLGSVREVVNQAGVLVARYDYDAYGKRSILFQSASYLNGCAFGYTGHLTLPSLAPSQSELVLTHYRDYDPQLGRWLSADPIGEAGGMNVYGYVGGDPLNSWDVLGLVSKTHYPGKDGTWRVDSEVNGPGKGGSVHINIGKNKFHFDPNTQSWSNRDAPNARLPKNIQCEMDSDSFKQKLGNAVNRVNEEGGGFGSAGSGISKYLPAVAALGIVIGLNESANAMGRYVEALKDSNWAGANEAAVEVAQSLPGVNMQQADLLMRLQDAIEKTQSGGNNQCQD